MKKFSHSDFSQAMLAAGLTDRSLADRWGLNIRQVRNIRENPKQLHWDALHHLSAIEGFSRSGPRIKARKRETFAKSPHV